jgi:hypothetical protein
MTPEQVRQDIAETREQIMQLETLVTYLEGVLKGMELSIPRSEPLDVPRSSDIVECDKCNFEMRRSSLDRHKKRYH